MLGMRTALAGLAALALSASAALAQKIEIKFGHVGEPGSLFDQSANEFAKRANARLAGKAEVSTYPGSQLGGDKEMLQKMKLGQLTLFLPSTMMSSIAPEFGVFEMPYIIKDRAHMQRVVEAMHEKALQPAAKAKGILLIGTWENGFRHITNNVRPIVKPEDLKGIKLRVPQGEWRVKMFQAYGANPTPMGFSELFTALKTGVMDGQENPYPQIYAAKLHEVQKFLSKSSHVYSPAWVAASPDHFAKLPADVQKVLLDTAKEMEGWVRETATRLDGELLKQIEASGIKVNEIDQPAFAAASKAIYDEYAAKVAVAADLIKQIQALAK